MATHSAILIHVDNTLAIGHYGHWDGHFRGVGSGVLQMCKVHLNTADKRTKFANNVRKITKVDDYEYEGDKLYEPHEPEYIIAHIAESNPETYVLSHHERREEYRYTVDLDKNTLRVESDTQCMQWHLDDLPENLPAECFGEQ